MVYFLGRDVDVYIFNESHATTANATIGTSGSEAVNGAATLSQTFATAMASGGSASNTLADFDKQNDITGIDVSTGVMDEDNSFVGQMQAGKVEIKKEVTVSLTRKKNNNCWDAVFNGARHGVESDGAFFGYGDVGHVNPARADYGYRVFIKLKKNTEVLTLPNCCITGHTVSLNGDGVTEETLELMCYVNPVITSGTENTDYVAGVTNF